MAEEGRALTAADVQAAAAAGRSVVVLKAGAVVTPLARDTAREVGIQLTGTDPDGRTDLEEQVRRIVSGLVGPDAGVHRNDRSRARPGVRHVDGRSVQLAPFPYDGPAADQDVRVADVVTGEHGSPIAAGFLTLTRGSFPWTLTYDEIEYVVEGELHIGVPEGTVIGRPGDVVYVPKGTAITFGTPSWAKFLYVTFPADWEAGAT